MKQRIITAFFMIIVLLPLVVIDHPIAEWGFFAVAIVFSMLATYELINMMYQKSPAMKMFRYIVPIFSGIIAALACLATKKANGDIRSAINTFQAIADTSHELTMKDVETCYASWKAHSSKGNTHNLILKMDKYFNERRNKYYGITSKKNKS